MFTFFRARRNMRALFAFCSGIAFCLAALAALVVLSAVANESCPHHGWENCPPYNVMGFPNYCGTPFFDDNCPAVFELYLDVEEITIDALAYAVRTAVDVFFIAKAWAEALVEFYSELARAALAKLGTMCAALRDNGLGKLPDACYQQGGGGGWHANHPIVLMAPMMSM